MLLLFILFLNSLLFTFAVEPHVSEASECMSLTHAKVPGLSPTRFLPGLVGIGWDDLTNVGTLPILANNYKTCQTVPDGTFIIPDNVVAIPVQKTSLDRLANYFKTFHDYKQQATWNVNAQVSGHYAGFGASGSFSKKHQTTKHTFFQEKSSLLHTKLIHHAYTFISDASGGFDVGFIGRLKEISHSLNQKLFNKAKYQAEMIIRDYGTHVIFKTLAGALVEQETYIDSTTDFSSSTSLDSIRAQASASFLKMAKASVSAGKIVTTTEENSLSKITHHSVIESTGGPDVNRLVDGNGSNSSVFHIDNLVGFEREGVFIHSLIHLGNFPDFPIDTITNLQELIQNVTEEYYDRNTIRGCMEPDANNFNFKANIDDGSCIPSKHNYTFNGIFQKCTPLTEAEGSCEISMTPISSCNGFDQINPMTQALSCSAGYESIPIVSVIQQLPDRIETRSKRNCHGHLFWKKCKNVDYQVIYKDRIRLDSFWCQEISGDKPEANTGAMFGGLYQDGKVNIFTENPGCPGFYRPYKLVNDLKVCISYDYEADAKYSIPFTGFFSCQSSVKKCENGYSQHLATIADNCAIYYCVRPNVFTRFEPPLLHRPPFVDPKLAHSNTTESTIRGFFDGQHIVEMSIFDITHEYASSSKNAAKRVVTNPSDSTILIEHEIVKEAVDSFIEGTHKQVEQLFTKYPGKTWIQIVNEMENGNGTKV